MCVCEIKYKKKQSKRGKYKKRKTIYYTHKKVLCEMVTLMPCSYLSAAPRCAGLIEKMIEIEPKVL